MAELDTSYFENLRRTQTADNTAAQAAGVAEGEAARVRGVAASEAAASARPGLIQRTASAARNATGAIGDATSGMFDKLKSTIAPGMPSATPPTVPTDTGIIRSLADGSRAVGSGVAKLAGWGLRAAPGVGGFVDGAGLLDARSAENVGTGNQPGTDVPTDLSPEAKARMAVPSGYSPPAPVSPIVDYLKRSRDGILSGVNNAGVDSVRQNLNALPGGNSIGLIGGLAQGGSRLAKVGAVTTEAAMMDRSGRAVGQGLVDTGFIQARSPTPSAATDRVARIIAETPMLKKPEVSSPESGTAPARLAPGTKVGGGGIIVEDQPGLVVPSTAAADQAFLSKAFQQHVNGGDLERARATATTEEDFARLGAAENAQVEARNAAYRNAPLISKLEADLNRSPRERALDEDVRTRAFGRTQKGGSPDNSQGIIAQLAALQGQKSADPGKAAADALNAWNNNQAAKANVVGQQLSQQGAKITQQGLIQMESLKQQIANEKDPAKLATLQEKYQTLTGKYQKPDPASKIVLIDVDSGEKDMMGKPIMMKAAFDPETKQIYGGPKVKQPSREEVISSAKDAVSRGANKDAVNAESVKRYGFAPL